MHPFTEIVDVWLKDDNGRVVFEFEAGPAAVNPRWLVLIDRPIANAKNAALPSSLRVPTVSDLKVEDRVEQSIPARPDGEIIVVDTGLQ